jgi:hypothetical protein
MITENKPLRIQRSRQHKQVSPNGLPITYVGRPGKWGNPFAVVKDDFLPRKWRVVIRATDVNAENLTYILVNTCRHFIYGDKEDAIADALQCFRIYIDAVVKANPVFLDELAGSNISCWCKPGEPCHGDVLLKLANKQL